MELSPTTNASPTMEDVHPISPPGQDKEACASVCSEIREKRGSNARPDDRIAVKAIEILNNLDRTSAHIEKVISVDIQELANVISDSYFDQKLARLLKHEELHNDPNALHDAEDFLAPNAPGVNRCHRALNDYIHETLPLIAPALTTLVGPMLAARLIRQAGSLEELVKLPASTIQLMGAEKAFRQARKQHSNTPKYGILFESTWVQQASPNNKGRMARKLAAKCALAARTDFFAPEQCAEFIQRLKQHRENNLRVAYLRRPQASESPSPWHAHLLHTRCPLFQADYYFFGLQLQVLLVIFYSNATTFVPYTPAERFSPLASYTAVDCEAASVDTMSFQYYPYSLPPLQVGQSAFMVPTNQPAQGTITSPSQGEHLSTIFPQELFYELWMSQGNAPAATAPSPPAAPAEDADKKADAATPDKPPKSEQRVEKRNDPPRPVQYHVHFRWRQISATGEETVHNAPADTLLGSYTSIKEANNRLLKEVYSRFRKLAYTWCVSTTFPYAQSSNAVFETSWLILRNAPAYYNSARPNTNWIRNSDDARFPNTWKLKDDGCLSIKVVDASLSHTVTGEFFINKE
ncbi:hypothetical protein F5Y18DRAFT_444471 [Xylariaceae sp. FL1019]|nr:hypothetical protein F5Y18DRAFT_444471 [Xylariaceae sp. FL1019]